MSPRLWPSESRYRTLDAVEVNESNLDWTSLDSVGADFLVVDCVMFSFLFFVRSLSLTTPILYYLVLGQINKNHHGRPMFWTRAKKA
jgi:hypothetical protein